MARVLNASPSEIFGFYFTSMGLPTAMVTAGYIPAVANSGRFRTCHILMLFQTISCNLSLSRLPAAREIAPTSCPTGSYLTSLTPARHAATCLAEPPDTSGLIRRVASRTATAITLPDYDRVRPETGLVGDYPIAIAEGRRHERGGRVGRSHHGTVRENGFVPGGP
jgi:hypothetical protein